MWEMIVRFILEALFLLWVIFWGGDTWMQGTLLGWWEFGRASERKEYVRFVAGFFLIASTIWFALELAEALRVGK
jgi:hypothetical protein